MKNNTVLILGAGSWGTALALHLSRLGQHTQLWSHQPKHTEQLIHDRLNQRFLPGYPFPPSLEPTQDFAKAVSNARYILIAVPSIAFRSMLERLQPVIPKSTPIISATKGLDEKTGYLLHETMVSVLGKSHPFAVLSGPSFAQEVAAEQPTAIVIASDDTALTTELLHRLTSSRFRVYASSDVIGVEAGGVVKNVLAIATGIADGMGLGANARSALITRGLAEMIRLGMALGRQYETFTGLAGLGDLLLTCTDDQSRNRRFGLQIGKGMTPTDAEKTIGQVVEGQRNTPLVVKLAKANNIDMPIVFAVWNILQGQETPKTAMEALLARTPKIENQ